MHKIILGILWRPHIYVSLYISQYVRWQFANWNCVSQKSCGEHVVNMTQVTWRDCNVVITILMRDMIFACVLVLVIMKFDIELHDTTSVRPV